MAAPPSVTLNNISGSYVMNRTISGDTDECLSMQKVGWITRKTLSIATVTVGLKHTTDEKGLETINIENTLTGGIKGSSEVRILDNEWRDQSDHIFGNFKSRARKVKVEEVEEAYLKNGWEEGTETLIEIESINEQNGWNAIQTWGFEVIDGVRRYSRHVKLTAGKKTVQCKMAYDYQPSA